LDEIAPIADGDTQEPKEQKYYHCDPQHNYISPCLKSLEWYTGILSIEWLSLCLPIIGIIVHAANG